MNTVHKIDLPDEAATQRFATFLAQSCTQSGCVHVSGDLGAGKTTLIRAWLRALGVRGTIKSPTYSLVEPYDGPIPVYHLDLYRLNDPWELEALGLRDWLAENALLLVEWPERGEGVLPQGDLGIEMGLVESSGRVAFLRGRWATRLADFSVESRRGSVQSHLKE